MQTGSGGENWNSRNHVNHQGNIPCGPGYTVEGTQGQTSGSRAQPLVVANLDAAALCLTVPEFWQQFPKAIHVEPTAIRLGIFPREWNDDFELQGGERKTSTILLRVAENRHH